MTSISRRFHFDITGISLRCHFDFTSMSLRFHLDFTQKLLLFYFVFTAVPLRRHLEITSGKRGDAIMRKEKGKRRWEQKGKGKTRWGEKGKGKGDRGRLGRIPTLQPDRAHAHTNERNETKRFPGWTPPNLRYGRMRFGGVVGWVGDAPSSGTKFRYQVQVPSSGTTPTKYRVRHSFEESPSNSLLG